MLMEESLLAAAAVGPGEIGEISKGALATQSLADQAEVGVLPQEEEGVEAVHGVNPNQGGQCWQALLKNW
ncbi:hypothetical protein I0E98_01310 [Pseudomonas lalucatii]|nr:hypothetical protein [Pseudomonas lalucatii]